MSKRKRGPTLTVSTGGIPGAAYAAVLLITIICGAVAYTSFSNTGTIGPSPSPSPSSPYPSPSPSPVPSPSPAPLNWKMSPMIIAFTWIDTSYGGFGTLSYSQMVIDVTNMKNLGFTAVLAWDSPLDGGTHDGDCASYTMTSLLQICQSLNMKVFFCFTEWTKYNYQSAAFASHLQALASYYKGYSNLAGLYWDDWGNGMGLDREPADPVGFDNLVRANFNIGRNFFNYYAFIDSINSGILKGKSLVGLSSASYVTSGTQDPYGIGWCQTMQANYGDAGLKVGLENYALT
jgi:hypothetical protein